MATHAVALHCALLLLPLFLAGGGLRLRKLDLEIHLSPWLEPRLPASSRAERARTRHRTKDTYGPEDDFCLSATSLRPPGQLSLATNVPRVLDDGAVNGLLAIAAPLHRPNSYSGSILIVVACLSSKQ